MMQIRRAVAAGVSIWAALAFTVSRSPAETAESARNNAPEEREAPSVEEAGLVIVRMAICRGVENRSPVGADTTFPRDVGRLYCFTEVKGAQEPTPVFHRWFFGDRLAVEIPIQVKGPRWRCWTRKRIPAGGEEAGRVEVATEEGDILATAEFRLE
jgi:hypothetical protein